MASEWNQGINLIMRDRVRREARKDLLAGQITINEYRKEIGMSPLPPDQGDVFIQPEGSITIGSDVLAKLLRQYGIVDIDEIEQFLKLLEDKSE